MACFCAKILDFRFFRQRIRSKRWLFEQRTFLCVLVVAKRQTRWQNKGNIYPPDTR